MEALELGLREALLKDGRRLLGEFLQSLEETLPPVIAQKGQKRHADRPRQVETIFGPVELRRDYLYSAAKHAGRAPLDEALGLFNASSPGLVRLVSRAAARQGYEAASDDLGELAGIHIDGRQIQRLVADSGPRMAAQLKLESPAPPEPKPIPILYVEADGTGVPLVGKELKGRRGKQPDGSAKTREVKLGCVFTQTGTDEEGEPVRDPDSTSYVGSFETAGDFGQTVRQEALRRGMARAQKVVFIGDGAAWVWELARINFPQATCILDFYHMLLYLHELARLLYGNDSAWAQRKKTQWKEQMQNDQVADVIASMHERAGELGQLPLEVREEIQKQIAYLENNRARMRYGTFRKQGYFYGSGVVEAGCRAVIGQRLKQSGMFWTRTGAENVIALRCALMGNRWDECWDQINNSRQFSHSLAA